MTKLDIKIGIIGGSGLYNIEGLTKVEEKVINTPWGTPSNPIEIYENQDQVKIAFISRHGKNHQLNPSEVPHRANISALKYIGVDFILSFTAVGSLNESMKPGDFVLPDQIFDRTKGYRENSLFDKGIVAHVPMKTPFDSILREYILNFSSQFQQHNIKIHDKGTLVVIEGPSFSTKFESKLYKSWGCDIINMSGVPEAKLAKEAEIAYQSIAMVTDFDCWLESEEVSVEKVMNTMRENSAKFNTILKQIVSPLNKDIQTKKIINSLKNQVSKSIVSSNMTLDAQDRLDFLFKPPGN